MAKNLISETANLNFQEFVLCWFCFLWRSKSTRIRQSSLFSSHQIKQRSLCTKYYIHIHWPSICTVENILLFPERTKMSLPPLPLAQRETQNIFPILKGSSLTIFLGRASRFFIELKQRENIKIETDCFNAL